MPNGQLDGRVAIVTGAGGGLGRAHALHLASLGARVIVNDLGASLDGAGHDTSAAAAVVEEIRAAGGEAAASHHDIADWEQARELIAFAVETFGALHALVNNAGITRDRTLAKMSEDEWDSVVRVHLKGQAAPTRHAAAYWRDAAAAGEDLRPSVINTTSIAGFIGSFGQANYSSAKLAVVALAYTAAAELARCGGRANAVSPGARTRMTLAVPAAVEEMSKYEEAAFDPYDPGNVSPLIGWLAGRDCPANRQVFHIEGDRVFVVAIPAIAHRAQTEGRWTWEALDRELPGHLVAPLPEDTWS